MLKKKILFCTEALIAEGVRLYKIPEEDYIDLNDLDEFNEQSKMRILEK